MKPRPSATDGRDLCKGAEAAALSLLATFLTWKPRWGKHLGRELLQHCQGAMEAAVDFAGTVRKDEAEEASLQAVGRVWERCDLLASAGDKDKKGKGVMSLDGVSACARVLQREREVVRDAIAELKEAVESGGEEDDDDDDDFGLKWSEGDKDLGRAGLGLMNVAQTLLKKVSESEPDGEAVEMRDLDKITDELFMLSALVDDFALTLYPPIEDDEVEKTSKDLTAFLVKVIELQGELEGIKLRDHPSWGPFLRKATDHNVAKLTTKLAERKVQNLSL